MTELLVVAANAAQAGDRRTRRRAIDALASQPRPAVARAAAENLERQLTRVWDRGWQPVDLCRVVRREVGDAATLLVRHVVAAQACSYEALGRRVAPGWMAQVDDAEVPGRGGAVVAYLLQLQADWTATLACTVDLLALLSRLPTLPELVVPPSRWHEQSIAPAGSLPDGLLERVRALLAKAESTTFDAEAEAFTAKAQE